jgi:ATP-dependent protease ClpP protease subunit
MDYIIEPQNPILDKMIINDYKYDNTIHVIKEIDSNTQVMFCHQLRKIAEKELPKSQKERKNIKIRTCSPGGSIPAVMAMVTYMEDLQEKGLIIETYGEGFVASGGSKILAAGSKGHRYITRYGNVLFHQPQLGKFGYSTLQEDIKSVEQSKRDWEQLKTMIRKHTKFTEQEIIDFTEKNIDVVYNPQECLEKGIVDHII